jgi:hypothetical protein
MGELVASCNMHVTFFSQSAVVSTDTVDSADEDESAGRICCENR